MLDLWNGTLQHLILIARLSVETATLTVVHVCAYECVMSVCMNNDQCIIVCVKREKGRGRKRERGVRDGERGRQREKERERKGDIYTYGYLTYNIHYYRPRNTFATKGAYRSKMDWTQRIDFKYQYNRTQVVQS